MHRRVIYQWNTCGEVRLWTFSMSRTQGSEHGNAFSRSAAHILIADDGCGGCVAQWSDQGAVRW